MNDFVLINYDCWAYPVFVLGGIFGPLFARLYTLHITTQCKSHFDRIWSKSIQQLLWYCLFHVGAILVSADGSHLHTNKCFCLKAVANVVQPSDNRLWEGKIDVCSDKKTPADMFPINYTLRSYSIMRWPSAWKTEIIPSLLHTAQNCEFL